MLLQWPYIRPTSPSGDVETDAMDLLTQNGKAETAAHCAAVAKVAKELALCFGLDLHVAVTAALLHDIANIVKPCDMLAYAATHGWAIDEAEQKHPFLLHQRMSAVLAQEVFGICDARILSVITHHTTLKPNPSDDDMALFLADKLAWDQAGTPPFLGAVSSALEHSLSRAALAYIDFVLDNGMILSPHTLLIEAKHSLEQRYAQ